MDASPSRWARHYFVLSAQATSASSQATSLTRPSLSPSEWPGAASFQSSTYYANLFNSYFGDETDLHNFIRAIRLTLSIAKSSPLADKLTFDYAKGNSNVSDVYWLADQDPATLTDEQIEKWLRTHTETLYHPVRVLYRPLWKYPVN